MNYHNITHCDMKNGDGLRVVLWVSGCEHRCKGCHNSQTWDKESGIEYDSYADKELFSELDHDYTTGITFSGGDPLAPYNLMEVLSICQKIRMIHGKSKTIWVYTGYTLDEIKNSDKKEILQYADVIVDGEYIEELRDVTLPWRGSSNQRVLYAPFD